MILITGCPRSGTHSLSRAFKKSGINLGHEQLGTHGTVSCYFFKPTDYYPNDCHKNDDFGDFVRGNQVVGVHLVRNPLKCIPSMKTIVGIAHRKWLHEQSVVDKDINPKILWSMNAWYSMNDYIERHLSVQVSLMRIRIEDFNVRHFNKILKMDGWDCNRLQFNGVERVHKSSGNRKSEPMTIDQMFEIDDKLARKIQVMGRRYGYGV